MKVGDNMEIYKGYYSDKKYQFIYNIEDIKKIVKPIFDEYKVNRVLLFGSYARNEASLISKDIDIFQISSIEIDSPIYKNIFSEGITIYDSKYNH